MVTQVFPAAQGRWDPTVNPDQEDLLEKLDLMESMDPKVGLVLRGNWVPSESRGQKVRSGLQELKGSRDRRERVVFLVPLGKMALKEKMEPRVRLVSVGQSESPGTKD